MAIDVNETLLDMGNVQKRSQQIRATTNFEAANNQAALEIVNTGKVQTAAVAESTEVAAEAARVSGRLRDVQSQVSVDMAQGQIEIEKQYNSDIESALKVQGDAAQVALKRSAELTEIASSKTINPLKYIVDSVKADFIRTDLDRAAVAYQGANALVVQAQDKRNRSVVELQTQQVALPMALATQAANTARTELEVRGIKAERTYAGAQINEDTTIQLKGIAQDMWQFNETNRARAERDAERNAQNHDGVYYIAGQYIAAKTGKFPTRAEIARDPVALANGRAIYATRVKEGDAGTFVIAGTRVFTEQLDQLGLSGQAINAKFADDAPTSFMEVSAEISGDRTTTPATTAAANAVLSKKLQVFDATVDPLRSEATKKAQRTALIEQEYKRLRNLPQPELYAEAQKSMPTRQAVMTGQDLNSANVSIVTNPDVAEKLGLSPQVQQLLRSPVANKIFDDAPMDTTRGTLEKLDKLQKYLEQNGVKDSYGVSGKVLAETTRLGYAKADGGVGAMYKAGKGEHIPISLKVRGDAIVRAPGYFSSTVKAGVFGNTQPAEMRDFAGETDIDLSDPTAMRRALLKFRKDTTASNFGRGDSYGRTPGLYDTPKPKD